MMDQLELATTTTLFVVAIIFILLGANKHHKHLKKVISIQDSTIKSLRDENVLCVEKVREKNLNITRLAADNAVLKQKVINLEGEVQSHLSESEKILRIFKSTGVMIYNSSDKEIEVKLIGGTCGEYSDKTDKINALIKDIKENIPKWMEMIVKDVETKPKEEKSPIHPNLQAYYNRGSKKPLKFIKEQQEAFKSFRPEDIRSAHCEPLDFSTEKKTDDIIDDIRKSLTKKTAKPKKNKK